MREPQKLYFGLRPTDPHQEGSTHLCHGGFQMWAVVASKNLGAVKVTGERAG